jgi:hypothetical protein
MSVTMVILPKCKRLEPNFRKEALEVEARPENAGTGRSKRLPSNA